MGISNEELIEKAVITADALAASGKLNPAQSDKFIDYVEDETELSKHARTVRFRNETLDIDKIGLGGRVAVPKAEAADPQRRRGIRTSKITLTPREIMVPFEIGDNFRDINIEGDEVEEHIVKMMAKQAANDVEELNILGDTLGPASPESLLLGEGGSDDRYMRDTFLALTSGWQRLSDDGHIVDAEGQNIGLSLFSRMIRAMPTKFRRNRNDLRFFMAPDLWQLYLEKVTTRATALGDSVAGGAQHTPFGIQAVPVPLWDMTPTVVEHATLDFTNPVALRYAPVQDVVVTLATLANTAVEPYPEGAGGYVLDAAAGTIRAADNGSGLDGVEVKITYRSNPQVILTHRNNFIIGIGRDIRIEKDREIFKGVNQYAITMKIAVTFEEVDAIAKCINIGQGV